MRLTYRMRVVWPTPEAWLRYVVQDLGVATLDDLVAVDGDGWVTGLDENRARIRLAGSEGFAGDGLRLVGGTHLAPGARYVVSRHDLTVGALFAEVLGSSSDREVRIDYREVARPEGGAQAVLHGLDRGVGVRATSRLAYLRGDLRISTTGSDVFHAEVELPWAGAEARASLDRAGSQLVVHVRVHGRGAWRLALAPVMAAGGAAMRKWSPDPLSDLPEWLAAVAAGSDADQAPLARLSPEDRLAADAVRRVAELDQAWADMLTALMELETQFELRPFLQRTRRAWRREAQAFLDSLPPRHSASRPLTPAEQWDQDRFIAAGALIFLTKRLHSPHRRRELPIRAEQARVERHRESEAVAKAIAESRAESRADAPTWDQLLDLSWLATPMTTMRHLRGAASTS